MKSMGTIYPANDANVAPRVGAWIEIPNYVYTLTTDTVAPRVGAWIEILPILKRAYNISVAPRVGAWIEIIGIDIILGGIKRRPPRGGVD